jgi:hypothetical protein
MRCLLYIFSSRIPSQISVSFGNTRARLASTAGVYQVSNQRPAIAPVRVTTNAGTT